MVLEQFRNSVSNHMAIYTTAHEAQVPGLAAVLADEYVFTKNSESQKVHREVFLIKTLAQT